MNVIVNAFAFQEAYGNSMQLDGRNDEQKRKIYMKDLVVSLTSAKLKNPEDEVLLVTNRDVPEPFLEQLKVCGIKNVVIPYDKYVMPKEFAWSLAFFKLCVLDYLANQTEYSHCLLLDTDTITMHSFHDLWEEAQHGLMLYPVNHTYEHPDRADIREDYLKLYPQENENIVHYGGEFICGSRLCLQEFLKECDQVYQRMMEHVDCTNKKLGDEAIIAMAAANYKKLHHVIEAGAYIFRYWTEKNYLIATNTVHNPVCIWHLPAEKDMGLILLYDYYRKHLCYPDAIKVSKMAGIAPARRPYPIATLRARLKRKMVSLEK